MRQGIFNYKDGTKKEYILFASQNNHIGTNGTFNQGDIVIEYDKLVEVLGEPLEGHDLKTQCEWVIEFNPKNSPRQIATIYDWKLGKQYLGDEGTDKENIKYWHVGGHDKIVVDYLEFLFMPLNKK
tara:strand:+ start:184 stop:561 length:378 start_codon:yes stop_codon:yes gene_type:complete